MHRPAFTRTQRRTRTTRRRGTRTLKNWLAWNRTARCRARTSCRSGSRWTDWRLINRPRSSLRHNHAGRWRALRDRRRWRNWSGRLRRDWCLSLRRRWCRRRRHRRRRHHGARRSNRGRNLRRRRNHVHRTYRRLRQDNPRRRRLDFRRCRRRRSHWSLHGWRDRLGLYRMVHDRFCGRRRRWRRLLADDGFKNISRLGDVRQVNLGLDFVRLSASAMARFGCSVGFAGAAQFRAHLFGFMLFQRTGVGLLLGDPNFGKHIKNRLALDFQFPGQIVDSNLAHLPSIFELSAKSSFQPHGISCSFI